MIVTLACLLLANSLYIYGLNAASHFEYKSEDHPELGVVEDSKMILWKFRWWSIKYIGKFWSKSLWTCPTCMSSAHSWYLFWLVMLTIYGFSLHLVFLYILYLGTLAGINYIAGKLIDMVESVTGYFNNH